MLHQIVAVILCYAIATQAQSMTTERPKIWRWSQVPNPRTHPAECGRRTQASWICDPNRILSFEGANEIDRIINQTRLQSQCPCSDIHLCGHNSPGYSMSVLVIPEFYTPNEYHGRYAMLREARQYLYSVFSQKWKFGRCNEFVVVMYAQDQNLLYTMTGQLAGSKIPDSTIERLSLNVKRYFQKGATHNVTTGLIKLLKEYKKRLVVPLIQHDQPEAQPLVDEEEVEPAQGENEMTNSATTSRRALIVALVEIYFVVILVVSTVV